MLLGPNNSPLTSGTGLPLALSPEGAPLLGPDGSPLSLAPDDEALLSWAGLPLLGPQVRLCVFVYMCVYVCWLPAHPGP